MNDSDSQKVITNSKQLFVVNYLVTYMPYYPNYVTIVTGFSVNSFLTFNTEFVLSQKKFNW